MLVITAVTLIPLSQVPNKLILYFVAAVMAGLVLYICYLIYAIRSLIYGIENEGIKIYYGRKKLLIPWDKIYEVKKQEKIKWMKFAGGEWPGNYTGYFKEIGKDKLIAAYSTCQQDVVIINTSTLRYVISPEDIQGFFGCCKRKNRQPGSGCFTPGTGK